MIILGIDPGTARMGWGVLEYDPKKKTKKTKLLAVDTLITHKDLELPYRLKFLYKGLKDIIKEYKPDVVVIEMLFFNTNAKTAIAVGQARGMCLLAAADKKIKVHEYTALTVKKAITGFGRAKKKEMQEAVKKELKLSEKIKSDDANDGVAMALCYIKKELENPEIPCSKSK